MKHRGLDVTRRHKWRSWALHESLLCESDQFAWLQAPPRRHVVIAGGVDWAGRRSL